MRRSGSRVSILMACRREVPFGHLASAKSLYPLGQPEKALGHEPQIDPCVANRQPPGLSASGTNPRRRYLIKMQRRWKHKINEGCQGQLATKRLSARRGLEVKLSFLLPVEGEIFFLTSPFIDQAIHLLTICVRLVRVVCGRGRVQHGVQRHRMSPSPVYFGSVPGDVRAAIQKWLTGFCGEIWTCIPRGTG